MATKESELRGLRKKARILSDQINDIDQKIDEAFNKGDDWSDLQSKRNHLTIKLDNVEQQIEDVYGGRKKPSAPYHTDSLPNL